MTPPPARALASHVDLIVSSRDVARFIEYPYRLYRGHRHWVPPLRRDERTRLSRDRNPFFEHADLALFLADRDGAIVGRVAAIDDSRHNEIHRENVGWFGFFEAEDQEAASGLLARAEQWAAARGRDRVRGPVNPSLNDTAGLQIDAFDTRPFVLMPYSPPEYPGYVERAGYLKVKDLYAWLLDLDIDPGARLNRIADRAERHHAIRVRTVDMRGFDSELRRLQYVFVEAWKDNWGFVPPTEREFAQAARELRAVVDPRIVLFAEIGGELAGVAAALPDFNQVLIKMNGRLGPMGLWWYLNRRRLITQGRLFLLGVLPQFRHTGLYAVLIREACRRGVAAGYRRGELSWTLEDNDAINNGIAATGAVKYKTYRLYEKPLSSPRRGFHKLSLAPSSVEGRA